MPGPINELGITCPPSSSFYVCHDKPSRFVGCCASDPCAAGADGTCPDADVRSTSFSPDKWQSIPPQSCGSSPSTSKALWYTCRDSDPPFMGCCEVNACSKGGCPAESLVAARLSERAGEVAVFLPLTTTTTTTTSTPTTLITMVSTATATTGAVIKAAEENGGMSTGATIGVAVMATIIGLAIIGALFFLVWRRLRSSQEDDDVPDFPHEKPDYDTSNTTRPISQGDAMAAIELQNIYDELTSPAAQQRLDPEQQQHLQQLQQESQGISVHRTQADKDEVMAELPATPQEPPPYARVNDEGDHVVSMTMKETMSELPGK